MLHVSCCTFVLLPLSQHLQQTSQSIDMCVQTEESEARTTQRDRHHHLTRSSLERDPLQFPPHPSSPSMCNIHSLADPFYGEVFLRREFKGQHDWGQQDREPLRGKPASARVSERFSEREDFQRFPEVFQRSSQRPSQRQISLSEALSPVAPSRVAP